MYIQIQLSDVGDLLADLVGALFSKLSLNTSVDQKLGELFNIAVGQEELADQLGNSVDTSGFQFSPVGLTNARNMRLAGFIIDGQVVDGGAQEGASNFGHFSFSHVDLKKEVPPCTLR
eukprot:TRINITY_DN6809_c0_g2_i2.p1 TRINITY_DN6809_c0_g2~~TRINITY_DN6809_c0_g2_i2.p1  ORF type:complete len:118 (+),score=16.33 TRINITY_DN6809_c0_g2_i2:40-393(+)